MQNPFSSTSIATGQSFCNRKDEQAFLKEKVSNGENVLLYSHRRFGKTSLIHKVIEDIKTQVTPIYIDLYGTVSIKDFITKVLRGISATETKLDKVSRLFQDKFSAFTLSFSVDLTTGAPVAIPSFTSGDQRMSVDEVFRLIERMSQKRKIMLVFDEFQEISRYSGDSLEKQLRSIIQYHKNVSYVFAGSQKSLLLQMFLDNKRAFYQQAIHLNLKKIVTPEYVEWVKGLYQNASRSIDDDVIERVVTSCDNHPMFIQEFFASLWEHESVNHGDVDRIEHDIVQRRETEFISIWDALTLNQKKTLKLIAITMGKDLFSAKNLIQVDLKAAAQVVAAIKVLEERELVSKNGTFSIVNPMFLKWIVQLH